MQKIASLQEAIKEIKQLMSEEKWREAHRACLEVLRFDPGNIKIIHFKNKIEKKVKKINIKAIKTDLQKLEPLKKEKKYEEFLLNLKKLEPYIQDYPQLKLIILEATKQYEQQLNAKQEVTYQSENQRIQDLLKKNQYHEALISLEKMSIMGIHSQEIKKRAAVIGNDWIDDEINKNKTLLTGKKFEDILLFYQKLLKINPKSTKVKKALEHAKKAYESYKIEEKKEFIYKSLEQIRTLYQLKNYEKAYEACAEVLDIDPNNKSAIKFRKRAAKKIRKMIDNEVVTQMVNNQKKLKQEYKSNRKEFVRILG